MAFVPFSIGQVSIEISAYGVKINYPASWCCLRPPRRVNLPTLGRFLCFSSVSNKCLQYLEAVLLTGRPPRKSRLAKLLFTLLVFLLFFLSGNYFGFLYRCRRIQRYANTDPREFHLVSKSL
jgi:hypothetical protein